MAPLTGLGLSYASAAMLVAVLAASGLMSGLAGFGFSAIGATALWILPPTKAVPLLMMLSTANQLLSMLCLREQMPALRHWWPAGPGPYILGGLLGIKLGLWLLVAMPAAAFVVALGLMLVGYAAWGHVAPAIAAPLREGGWRSSAAVGLVGGTIGGFSAFPGAAVVVWGGLCGMKKDRLRAITQPYILAMQIVAMAMLLWARPQTFDGRFFALLALCLPAVLPLTLAGVWIYRRTSDVNFRRVALALLGVSGAGLVGRGIAVLV